MMQTATANAFSTHVSIRSTSKFVAPMIDISRFNLIATENDVDNAAIANGQVYVINAGSNYTSTAVATISGGNGTGATMSLTIVNGEITAIAMDSTRKGSGYESSYAVIDEGESNEEILELKYYDRFATRRFNADVNMLTNGDFEQKTTAFWSTKLGTIDPTGKVATVAIYGGGTGYSSGIAATTGGSAT